MSATPTFGTQLIGQTEKALGAFLDPLLEGSNITEPQWVTLAITVAGGGNANFGELTHRVAGVLKVSDARAGERIQELAAAQLLELPESEASPVKPTEAGQKLFSQIRASVTEITERLWGDLPAEDLAVAASVLGAVLARANEQLSEPRS
jgi:DNA-binding MarR family transcriptional regulator